MVYCITSFCALPDVGFWAMNTFLQLCIFDGKLPMLQSLSLFCRLFSRMEAASAQRLVVLSCPSTSGKFFHLFCHDLSHHELLYLSRHRFGKIIPELDVSRDLEVRNLKRGPYQFRGALFFTFPWMQVTENVALVKTKHDICRPISLLYQTSTHSTGRMFCPPHWGFVNTLGYKIFGLFINWDEISCLTHFHYWNCFIKAKQTVRLGVYDNARLSCGLELPVLSLSRIFGANIWVASLSNEIKYETTFSFSKRQHDQVSGNIYRLDVHVFPYQ